MTFAKGGILPWLRTMLDFCFAQDELFVIPIEALCPEGVRSDFAEQLLRFRHLDDAWLITFNRAFQNYWHRAAELYRRAPDDWYPPRKQNVCVVSRPDICRPYSHPFPGSSWLLFESDFEQVDEEPELATYLFLHAERASLSQSAQNAFLHNLSYFAYLRDTQLQQLQKQCASSQRPDATSFGALAKFLGSSPQIFHPTLSPLPSPFDEPCGRIDGANVLIPTKDAPYIQAFAKAIHEDGQAIVEKHYGNHSRLCPNALDRLYDWLNETAPRIQVRIDDAIAWDPSKTIGRKDFHTLLHGIPQSSSLSLLDDLAVIHERSSDFLHSLQDPNCLPKSGELEQEGSLYIDPRSHAMVYSLREPSLDLTREPTPPYGRWLLGARTVHEWAHLAVDAKLVGLAPQYAKQEAEDRQQVARILRSIVERATGPCRALHAHELSRITRTTDDAGQAWCDYLFSRLPDFQCNLLLPHFAKAPEVESYLRLNVRCHHQDTTGLYTQLMRYAFEGQYLRLCGIQDPLGYILDSVWFDAFFVTPGIITQDEMQALYDAVASVCSHQRIRESAFFAEALSQDEEVPTQLPPSPS